jgi:hypothetical protein
LTFNFFSAWVISTTESFNGCKAKDWNPVIKVISNNSLALYPTEQNESVLCDTERGGVVFFIKSNPFNNQY